MVLLMATDKVWLFAKDVKGKLLAKFMNASEEASVNGNMPVFRFSTELGENTIVLQNKCINTKAIKLYSNDTDKWVGKDFYLSVQSNKFLLEPLEQKL
jgi:hypothetical protein